GVASIYSVGMHHMSQYIKTFEDRYPQASVRLEYLHPTRVIERVAGGGADLGLISYPRKWPELTVIPWREEIMILAVHPGHRFASRETVNIRELDGEAFVAFDGDLSIRRAIDRCLHHHGVNVEVVLEFDNIENIKRAVEIPAGVSILPEPSLAREVRAGSLVAVRISGQDPKYQLNRPLAIIRRRNDNLDLTAARFLELLAGQTVAKPPLTSPGASRRVPATSSP
ncbi:MAG: LysR family transcriptional regulator substrate-binding protein, partial [Isosphaeraceae bacterium]